MKRNFILTFLACGASVMLCAAAQAQTVVSSTTSSPSDSPAMGGHKHGRAGGGGVLVRLTDSLGLSGSQQAAIAPIIEAAKPQLRSIQENAKAQRMAVFNSVRAQITPLLTPDQQTKFAQEVQNFENAHAGGGNGRKGGKGGHNLAAAGGGGAGDAGVTAQVQRLTTQLGLTTDQQNQIKPILEAAHTQIQAVRQNTSLTREQQLNQIKATMQAAHSQINGILTPAQQQELMSTRETGHNKRAQTSASPSPASN